jgi:hypothetical protein
MCPQESLVSARCVLYISSPAGIRVDSLEYTCRVRHAGTRRMRICFRRQSLADSPKVFSGVSAGNQTVSMRIVTTIVCTSSSRKYDLVVTRVAGDKRTLVRNGNENENENNLTDLPNVFSGVAQCSMRTYRMNFMTAEITTKEKTQLSDRTCQMCSQELVSAQCVSYVP